MPGLNVVNTANKARGYPGSILVLRVDKSLLSTPGRVNYSCPTYYVNRESVPFTLDEAIFEVASEAISK